MIAAWSPSVCLNIIGQRWSFCVSAHCGPHWDTFPYDTRRWVDSDSVFWPSRLRLRLGTGFYYRLAYQDRWDPGVLFVGSRMGGGFRIREDASHVQHDCQCTSSQTELDDVVLQLPVPSDPRSLLLIPGTLLTVRWRMSGEDSYPFSYTNILCQSMMLIIIFSRRRNFHATWNMCALWNFHVW